MLIGEGNGKGKSVHLIGIGGSGMNGVARLLLQSGYAVSGSDAVDSKNLADIEALGARVFIGHHAHHITGADTVIVSPAIPPGNDELRAAQKAGLPIVSRAEALAEMLAERQVICVAGSHGKTTTTAMLTHILSCAGYEPGFYIGGRVPVMGGETAQIGTGKLFVMEACEAFRALDCWLPQHCIITNITDEHIDHYDGRGGLLDGFTELAGRVGPDGILAVCGDDESALLVANHSGQQATKFGFNAHNNVSANIHHLGEGLSHFQLIRDGEILGEANLYVPGQHNVCNALAAISVALDLGVIWPMIREALLTFTGVERRWQFIGEARGIRLFDDYAHHPVEIAATLKTARATVEDGGRLIVVFEPQLFSRVTRLQKRMGQALSVADLVLLAPVDAAGESSKLDAGVDTMIFTMETHGCEVTRLDDVELAASVANLLLRTGDVVVSMGPGEIRHVGARLLELLHSTPKDPLDATDRFPIAENPSMVAGPVVEPLAPTVLNLIEAHVLRNPDATAISVTNAQLDYGELWQTSNQLARYLIDQGARSQQVIAVCLQSTVHRVRAFLAILRAGCIYLPIDTRLPVARIRHMLRDSSANCLLLEDETADLDMNLDLQIINLDYSEVDRDTGTSGFRQVHARQLAYIIYTSGTTGLPKGSGINHRALCNLASTCVDTFEIGFESRVLQAFPAEGGGFNPVVSNF